MAILQPSKRDTPHKNRLLEKYRKLKDNDDEFSFDDNVKKEVVIDYDTEPATSSSDESDQDDQTKVIDNKVSTSSYNSTNEDGPTLQTKPQHQHDERQLSLGGWDAFNLKDASLKPDMLFVAEALNLDLNTKTMLAKFDARTLEDCYLMGDQDFEDLIEEAKAMGISLPPLQIRKVQIFREWLKKVIEDIDESKLPSWARTHTIGKTCIPRDWQSRFKEDLPKLKKDIKQRGQITIAQKSYEAMSLTLTDLSSNLSSNFGYSLKTFSSSLNTALASSLSALVGEMDW